MSKELREMLQNLEGLKAQVRAHLAEDKVGEAEKMMDEVRALQKKVAMQQELEAAEDAAPNDGTPVGGADRDLDAEYHRVFMRGLRRRRISAEDRSVVQEYRAAVMHEGGITNNESGDSSLIIPQDIQTKINKLMRTLNDLTMYVRIEKVNTLSGSRVLEKDEDMTPFQLVAEYGEISVTDNPRFTPVAYELKKRAGYLPLTSELLADTDQNILAYVINWIGRKHVVTKNGLIVSLLSSLDPEVIAGLDGIKQALNVDLDPAISLGASIITNQDGYHWLDTLVDDNGRYLLQDDITEAGRKLLKGRPVAVVSNRHLPTVEGDDDAKLAPLFIGDGKQFSVMFTRGTYELASTTEGGDAWRRDATELRTITRDDLVKWDEAAMVYRQIELP